MMMVAWRGWIQCTDSVDPAQAQLAAELVTGDIMFYKGENLRTIAHVRLIYTHPTSCSLFNPTNMTVDDKTETAVVSEPRGARLSFSKQMTAIGARLTRALSRDGRDDAEALLNKPGESAPGI